MIDPFLITVMGYIFIITHKLIYTILVIVK